MVAVLTLVALIPGFFVAVAHNRWVKRRKLEASQQ